MISKVDDINHFNFKKGFKMRKLGIGIASIVGMILLAGCGGSSGSSTQQQPIIANDIYLDKDMGLMWQDDTDSATIRKSWLEQSQYSACVDDTSSGACEDTSGDTSATYCSNLVLGEYTNWRLPTEDELLYLGDSKQYLNLKNYHKKALYWTSESSSKYMYSAISVTVFEDPIVARSGTHWKIHDFYVRCVRNI